jgi:hypothetical protein
MQETRKIISNHQNSNVHATAQREAIHRKWKKLKLGGGQDYDCTSV